MTTSLRLSLAALAGLTLVGSLGACSATGTAPPSTGSGGTDSGNTDSGNTDSGDTDTSAQYADGTYFAEGQYVSPGATETIGVEITLVDDVVTEVTITPHGESANAKRFQGEFADGIGDEIIGKDIDTLNVTRVAGSSLTSGGFRRAVDEIKAAALG